MKRYLTRAGFRDLLGISENGMNGVVAAYPPDVRVAGRYMGWALGRVHRYQETGKMPQRRGGTGEYIGISQAAVLVHRTPVRCIRLHKAGRFAQAAVVLEPLARDGYGRDGFIYGFTEDAVLSWARESHRLDENNSPVPHRHGHHAPGVGANADLPRCGWPNKTPPHRLCRSVRQRDGEGWAAGCARHQAEAQATQKEARDG